MNQLKNRLLAEIVSEHNSTAVVFEKYDLDFCSGKLQLSDSLSIAGASLKELLKELELAIENESAENINYNMLSLTEISEILRMEYHEHLRSKISELTALSRKIQSEHKSEFMAEIHEQLLAIFNHLAPHMVQEEKVLFPYLEYMEHMVLKGKVAKRASFGKIKKSVATMLDEHKDSTDKLNLLRHTTNDYHCEDDDAELQYYYNELKELDRNLRMHIHIENNVLFKKAKKMEKSMLLKQTVN
jgi:regulator of cell morphogenesis and NO signaling